MVATCATKYSMTGDFLMSPMVSVGDPYRLLMDSDTKRPFQFVEANLKQSTSTNFLSSNIHSTSKLDDDSKQDSNKSQRFGHNSGSQTSKHLATIIVDVDELAEAKHHLSLTMKDNRKQSTSINLLSSYIYSPSRIGDNSKQEANNSPRLGHDSSRQIDIRRATNCVDVDELAEMMHCLSWAIKDNSNHSSSTSLLTSNSHSPSWIGDNSKQGMNKSPRLSHDSSRKMDIRLATNIVDVDELASMMHCQPLVRKDVRTKIDMNLATNTVDVDELADRKHHLQVALKDSTTKIDMKLATNSVDVDELVDVKQRQSLVLTEVPLQGPKHTNEAPQNNKTGTSITPFILGGLLLGISVYCEIH